MNRPLTDLIVKRMASSLDDAPIGYEKITPVVSVTLKGPRNGVVMVAQEFWDDELLAEVKEHLHLSPCEEQPDWPCGFQYYEVDDKLGDILESMKNS